MLNSKITKGIMITIIMRDHVNKLGSFNAWLMKIDLLFQISFVFAMFNQFRKILKQFFLVAGIIAEPNVFFNVENADLRFRRKVDGKPAFYFVPHFS
jgi:hypothetical protein